MDDNKSLYFLIYFNDDIRFYKSLKHWRQPVQNSVRIILKVTIFDTFQPLKRGCYEILLAEKNYLFKWYQTSNIKHRHCKFGELAIENGILSTICIHVV